MKHSILSIAFLLIASVAITGFQQQEKDKKDKKEQQADKNKGKKDKAANENNNKNDQPGNKNQRGKEEKNTSKGNNKDHDNNGKGDDKNHRNFSMKDGYVWDRETFKDRNKYKNQEKVTICHKFNNDNEPAVTLRVSANALKAHIDHGDVEGDCPDFRDNRYSDNYLRERNDYYEKIQESREKVFYSQSILDYAVQRLTDSRVQLATMRTNNLPQVEIERKQLVVTELEENVSLLETLIGVTANLLANKLQ